VFAGEPALSAAERQPADARGGDAADRRREAERLRLPVEFAAKHARLRPHGLLSWIDADAFHARRIDHQAAVAHCVPGDAVTAAFYRNDQVVFTGKAHRGSNVGGAKALRDQCRSAVDHAVKKLARLVITVIAALQQPPAQTVGKALYRRLFEGGGRAFAGDDTQSRHDAPRLRF